MSYFHAGGIDRPLVIRKEGQPTIIPHENWRGQFARGTYTGGAVGMPLAALLGGICSMRSGVLVRGRLAPIPRNRRVPSSGLRVLPPFLRALRAKPPRPARGSQPATGAVIHPPNARNLRPPFIVVPGGALAPPLRRS